MYSLTVIGYMGNNILPGPRRRRDPRLPRRAARANTSKRTVVGTLVAERLLDVAVLLVIFVVVGYGLLGQVGGNSVELIAIVAVVGIDGCGRRLAPDPPQRERARRAGAARVAPRSACAGPTTASGCSP